MTEKIMTIQEWLDYPLPYGEYVKEMWINKRNVMCLYPHPDNTTTAVFYTFNRKTRQYQSAKLSNSHMIKVIFTSDPEQSQIRPKF